MHSLFIFLQIFIFSAYSGAPKPLNPVKPSTTFSVSIPKPMPVTPGIFPPRPISPRPRPNPRPITYTSTCGPIPENLRSPIPPVSPSAARFQKLMDTPLLPGTVSGDTQSGWFVNYDSSKPIDWIEMLVIYVQQGSNLTIDPETGDGKSYCGIYDSNYLNVFVKFGAHTVVVHFEDGTEGRIPVTGGVKEFGGLGDCEHGLFNPLHAIGTPHVRLSASNYPPPGKTTVIISNDYYDDTQPIFKNWGFNTIYKADTIADAYSKIASANTENIILAGHGDDSSIKMAGKWIDQKIQVEVSVMPFSNKVKQFYLNSCCFTFGIQNNFSRMTYGPKENEYHLSMYLAAQRKIIVQGWPMKLGIHWRPTGWAMSTISWRFTRYPILVDPQSAHNATGL